MLGDEGLKPPQTSSNAESSTAASFDEVGVIAIVRRPVLREADSLVDTLYEAGIGAVEFTLDSEDAMAVIRRSAERHGGRLAIGAGTVLYAEQVDLIADAGASFCVSPGLVLPVVERSLAKGLLAVPGAFTATEVAQAAASGAQVVKLFPAGLVGPPLLRALRGPFPSIPFLATGAIELHEVGEYATAGACGVGLGSPLIGGGVPLALGDIGERARYAVERWRQAPRTE